MLELFTNKLGKRVGKFLKGEVDSISQTTPPIIPTKIPIICITTKYITKVGNEIGGVGQGGLHFNLDRDSGREIQIG